MAWRRVGAIGGQRLSGLGRQTGSSWVAETRQTGKEPDSGLSRSETYGPSPRPAQCASVLECGSPLPLSVRPSLRQLHPPRPTRMPKKRFAQFDCGEGELACFLLSLRWGFIVP